eukprot:gnl/TRDRNA2_/TRDRNA2_59190_c0_seq1.p1 gnl/TRDRNA2_/TRDRNA2_59190_c0~~gnl/TRDRNA2_/TRDRNA2_59190_c0_seq1.p1  ORF type:complete len:373 (+),score=38.11 gnl/TRDRNA2_/TRDRNA2_59190_c0_seq1:161-1120(+)
MPAVQAWNGPPTAKRAGIRESSNRCKLLAQAARKIYAKAGNAPFWVAARATPKTLLEQFAHDVFWFHVRRLGWTKDAVARLGRAAGAEFWVQRRLSSQAPSERGVGWHYDKDEDLLDDCGLFLQPFVATATYLTGKGAPLVVLERPTLLPGEGDDEPQVEEPDLGGRRSSRDAFVAFPAPGLHVAFRGNLLHGVPPTLEARRGERLSLLLNVWLHHRPLNLRRCPVGLSKSRPATSKAMSHVAPRAGHRLRIRGKGSKTRLASDSVSLTPDVGSWELCGLYLPTDLPPEGVWRVNQASLAISCPDQECKPGGRRKRKQT